MGLDDAEIGVLYRHVMTAEGYHLAAVFHVEVI